MNDEKKSKKKLHLDLETLRNLSVRSKLRVGDPGADLVSSHCTPIGPVHTKAH